MISSENNVVVGLQWGFENKKRLTDFFANRSETIVRFNGSSSGGHTINAGGENFVLDFLPCGVHHDGKLCAIAAGVAVDLECIVREIEMLKEAGVLKSRLLLSGECPLILDFHKKMDVLERRFIGAAHDTILEDIGVSQALADMDRGIAIHAFDLLDAQVLKNKLDKNLKLKNAVFTQVFHERPSDPDETFLQILSLAKTVAPYIGQVRDEIAKAVENNSGVLFEGCDGSMIDAAADSPRLIRSGARTAVSLFQSAGLRHNCSLRVIGAAKAYSVRGRGGAFITEEKGSIGAFLRIRGAEFDESVDEPRRIGWLDLPALAYSARINSADLLALTKLDVLTGIDELKVCTSYMLDGKETTRGDLTNEEAARAKPIYAVLEGWKEDIQGCSDIGHLPRQTQDYIRLIEDYTGIRVIWAGLGREWGNALYNPGLR